MHFTWKKDILAYGKVLIAISIVLFLYGIILDIRDFNSNKGGKVINPTGNIINITEIDDINDSNKSNYSSNIEDDGVFVDDKINTNLRNSIEKKYSVIILYGDDTEGYKIAGLETKKITDKRVINEQLRKLDNILSKYPKDMFKEIKKGGIPLTIYLINNYSNPSITGITDSNYDYANISIAVIYPIEESFYHESFHYIERYLLKKGANFNSWDSLNPSGFNWGTVDGNYSYSVTSVSTASFVNNYAQTSAAEDRASTFEYMMMENEMDCLKNRNNTIWLKANYMAMTMEATLNSVSPNNIEYWERWVKND